MIRFLTSLVILVGLSIHGLPAMAQWSGGLSVGVVNATGNSRSSSFNAAADLARKVGDWSHGLEAEIYRAESDGEQEADRLGFGYKVKREIGSAWYGWASAAYTSDEFASIDRRMTGALGVGKHVLTGPVHLLDVEAGLGWRRTELLDPVETESEAILRAGIDYQGKITESTQILQKLLIESGSENTLLESKSGLKVMMSKRLSLVLAYSVRRNSDIVGKRGGKTDTLTTINVAYSF